MKKVVFIVSILLLFKVSYSIAEPIKEVEKDTRCSVCGMFVAKYPAWISQILFQNGKNEFFDGVKDMMAFYFQPRQYGGQKDNPVKEIWVKDYYSLNWSDGRKAFYVTGSDVYGPMGHEFIPFSSREAAEAFAKDHKGKSIFEFDQITGAMVDSMRVGTKMK